MNICVNGKELKLNIGCRTFISAIELLKLLGISQDHLFALLLNSEEVPLQNLPNTVVARSDTVTLHSVST